MYTQRADSNVMRMYQKCENTWVEFDFVLIEDFLLPREEARRLFRAYNQVWDLQIDENKVQRAFDMYSRNGNVVINEVLKELAKWIEPVFF